MKLGNKEKNLIKGLIGIVLAVLVWMFVASPIKEKKEALAVENESLKVTKDEYEAVNAQKSKYEQGMTTLKAEREELLEDYPSGMIREDEIMYWANMERANAGQLILESIAMDNLQEVIVGEAPSSEEEGATQLHLYKAPVNYGFKSTYDGLKGMADYVFAQNDKKSIETLSAAYNTETGNLEGSLSMNMYYMVGTGKDHTPATIPSVPTGVSNVFNATNTRVISDADVAAGNLETPAE
ncbi:MAG: hypothetical protein IKQ44_10855 [Lachnospiraceae bacterium]|jgi:hypothetical protein|nr:hypothetical protein [Lachnospiraceae bacterium]